MRFFNILVAVMMAFAVSTTSKAEVIESFGDYTVGAPLAGLNQGTGWSGAWSAFTNGGGGAQTNVVSDTSPFGSGGNYHSSTNNTIGDTSIGRNFTTTSAVTNPNTDVIRYKFDLRIDSLAGFNTTSDYFGPHATNGGNRNVSAASSWIIRAYGADNGGAQASKWALFNSPSVGASFNTANLVDSGMALAAGKTYSFVIDSDFATKKYSGSISDGTTTFNFSNLGLRSGTLSDALSFTGRVESTSDSYGFSVDNISIGSATAIPEPSSLAVLGLGSVIAMRVRRRKA